MPCLSSEICSGRKKYHPYMKRSRIIFRLADKEFSERAKYLVTVVEKYSNLVGRISAAEILSRFLEESGYLAAMAMGGYHRNIQNMRKLVSDAQNSGVVSVPDFLNTITELKNVAVREGEASSVAEGSVQIMTVHQAKGLEFPIVILGDASKKDRFGRDILIDPVLGIVPPLSDTRIVEDDPKLSSPCDILISGLRNSPGGRTGKR